MTTKIKKKQKLRNNEYYNTQEMFDDLYQKSINNYKFHDLLKLIQSDENIELAFRSIKKNTGSKTSGTNGKTIEDLKLENNKELINYVRNRLTNYQPHEVRRVEIPKANGKTRPLGIPTIEDRIIQQCIKQVLEPICEAKFFKHSYGFRPNRSTEHAIARSYTLANKNKLHYVVDIDIKGFFDNVNHGKLIKQMWTLGIQDKQLICIISKMLKAPIKDIGIPTKGTPQGGILSPLLSNIVLNELDWWIANQWENFETRKNYDTIDKRNGKICNSGKYRALKTSNLKEIFMVRYADDFKIFCRDHKTANKIFKATQLWLKERLHLDISTEKSKIVNLRKNYSEFLGIKMKIVDKGNKKVIKSHINDKAKERISKQIKQQIFNMAKNTSVKNVNKYNATILGMHNYYKVATHVNINFGEVAYKVNKNLYNKTKQIKSKNGVTSKAYEKFYGQYNFKRVYVNKIALFPIAGIITKPPLNFTQEICNYTLEGRKRIHEKQKSVSNYMLEYLMKNPIPSESIEYNDNRISLYVGQNGICPISKTILEIGSMECHHKIPKNLGGTDEYKNLIFIKSEIHKIIHATTHNTITKYLSMLNIDENTLKKVNELRKMVGNPKIA